MKIFINNPFPLLILKQETSVRCLDLSTRWVLNALEKYRVKLLSKPNNCITCTLLPQKMIKIVEIPTWCFCAPFLFSHHSLDVGGRGRWNSYLARAFSWGSGRLMWEPEPLMSYKFGIINNSVCPSSYGCMQEVAIEVLELWVVTAKCDSNFSSAQ